MTIVRQAAEAVAPIVGIVRMAAGPVEQLAVIVPLAVEAAEPIEVIVLSQAELVEQLAILVRLAWDWSRRASKLDCRGTGKVTNFPPAGGGSSRPVCSQGRRPSR